MILKIASFIFLFTSIVGKKFYCSHDAAVTSFKRPTYEFSVNILDKVAQQTNYHFVFSPLSTWLQLMSLAEGANGSTKQEIWKVTRYHRMKCFRRKFREILNSMDEELKFMTKRVNVMIIDKLLDVKHTFKDEVRKLNSTKMLTLNFNDPVNAVQRVNEVVDVGGIEKIIDADDFNLTVLLTTDTSYFKSDWQIPFDPLFTTKELFFSESKIPIGEVKLMSQIGSFNLTEIPSINAKILELPFNTNGRFSMLIFLPTEGNLYDLFYKLKKIRLMSIFNKFKAEGVKLVRVRLPRFKITSELQNIPELLYDMGLKRMFYQDLADFSGISDYNLHTSLMTQVADIEITEKGASSNTIAQFLTKINDSTDFIADRPFGYLIVDKQTEVILFGGIYKKPTVY